MNKIAILSPATPPSERPLEEELGIEDVEELGIEDVVELGIEVVEEFRRPIGYMGTMDCLALASHLHWETEKLPRS
jgi:hypothetical protein